MYNVTLNWGADPCWILWRTRSSRTRRQQMQPESTEALDTTHDPIAERSTPESTEALDTTHDPIAERSTLETSSSRCKVAASPLENGCSVRTHPEATRRPGGGVERCGRPLDRSAARGCASDRGGGGSCADCRVQFEFTDDFQC
jgi:hypothetical protein